MSDEAQRLLNEGLALLKDNKRAQAADTLKKAIELDTENVDIWKALAQALDNRDEKRIALTTLLQLDPGNEYAQENLDALEKAPRGSATSPEWRPGITRKEFNTAVLGLTAFTVLVLGVAFLFYSSRSGAIAAERASLTQIAADATQISAGATQQQETAAAINATQAADATATQLAFTTPTPTATNTPVRMLPTAIPPTATPSLTPDTSVVAPPPPANLSGRLIATGGRVNTSTEFRNLFIYPVGGGDPTELNNDLGQSPTADDAFSRVAYARSVPGGGVSLITVQSENPSPLLGIDIINALFQLEVPASDPRSPRLTRDGTKLVVSALVEEKRALYVYEYASETLVRITPNDGADYFASDISPDGTQVIAVKRTIGTDLVLIAAADQQNAYPQTPLTTDGDTTIEDNPTFSPDGVQVVFSARTSSTAQNDLFIAALQGSTFASVVPLVSSSGSDILPVFSPDGAYVAYTSDETGTPNIFIFELATRTIYQRTSEITAVLVGGWSN